MIWFNMLQYCFIMFYMLSYDVGLGMIMGWYWDMNGYRYSLWLCQQFAIEHGHWKFVSFPFQHGGFVHSYVKLPEGSLQHFLFFPFFQWEFYDPNWLCFTGVETTSQVLVGEIIWWWLTIEWWMEWAKERLGYSYSP